jgi:hypothetical protein
VSATPGSIYQALLLQHIAGNPPNSDPQRSTETFQGYFNRMAGIYLPPDIYPTESDSAYLARLLTYVPAPPTVNITSSYALTWQVNYVVSTSFASSSLSSSYVPAGDVDCTSGNVLSSSYAVTSSYS